MWRIVPKHFFCSALTVGSTERLTNLVLGKVDDCPLQLEDISERKNQTIVDFEAAAHASERDALDRGDIPIDFGFVDLLLRVAGGRSGPFLSLEKLKWQLGPECHVLSTEERVATG